MKYLICLFLILFITNTAFAGDGKIGTTSTATCTITLIIPPRVGIDYQAGTIAPNKSNLDLSQFNQEVYYTNGKGLTTPTKTDSTPTKVIILMPK
jgi:hypothetical protein